MITDTAMNAATADRDARRTNLLPALSSVDVSPCGSCILACVDVVFPWFVVVDVVVAAVVTGCGDGGDIPVVVVFTSVSGDAPSEAVDVPVVSPIAIVSVPVVERRLVTSVTVDSEESETVVVVAVVVVVVVDATVVVGGVVSGATSGGSTCMMMDMRVEQGFTPASVARTSTWNVSIVNSGRRERILPEVTSISKLSRTTLSVLTPKLKLTLPLSLKSSSVAVTTTTVVLTAADALTVWTLSASGPWNTGQWSFSSMTLMVKDVVFSLGGTPLTNAVTLTTSVPFGSRLRDIGDNSETCPEALSMTRWSVTSISAPKGSST